MARGVTYQRQYIDSCSLGLSNTQTQWNRKKSQVEESSSCSRKHWWRREAPQQW